MFFHGSRYEGVDEAEWTAPDGRVARYKLARLVPAVEPGPATYRVRPGDRHDLAAYNALGDAEAFWRLCDAAHAMRPADLVAVPGRRLPLPLPGPAIGFGGGEADE